MTDLRSEVLAASAPRAAHPRGWEPGYEQSGTTATGTAVFADDIDPQDREIIAGFGLDPETWAIVGNVNCRRWQTYDERWLRYYKCDLVRRVPATDRADVDALCKLASSRKLKRPAARTETGWVSFAALNDWQIGKGEGGGTTRTVDFLLERLARLEDQWRRDKPATIFLGNEGDLSEAVTGHYASQAFTVDLDQREQDRLVRRLLFQFVETAARRAPKVIVSGVACNHGENRGPSGKSQTRPSDNRSLTYVENVAEMCAMNPDAFGHVEFQYAPSTVLVSEMAGVSVAHTHGHIFGSGSPMASTMKWWTGQAMGMQPAAAATVLMTAHRHHAQFSEETGRTVFMWPACDGGSQWFTDSTGKSSPRGLGTVKIGTGIGDPLNGERCWDDLRIL